MIKTRYYLPSIFNQMKIDVHTHTKKVKSGDAPTRNIDSNGFVEIIKNTDVRILAITNHNHFDLDQYNEFVDASGSHCQIWPGIELDVIENGKRGHLIVIVNPKNSLEFSETVEKIISTTPPDDFTLSIEKTVQAFDKMDCIYIAHYHSKKPNLGDEELAILEGLVSNQRRILKEASNSISAGIYVSHGHNSIYGSDVQDWSKYTDTAKELPDLRLPIDTFDHFCLLLEKDEATINTLLNKKVKETIELTPFGIAELIRLDIYNDINVLFGSKGTGKTEILEALSKYFNSKGHKTSVYRSNDNHLNNEFDLRGNNFELDITQLQIDECADEIKLIKEAREEGITSMQKYLQHFTSNAKNKIAQKLKIKDVAKSDEGKPQRKLKAVADVRSEFIKFKQYIGNKNVSDYLDQDLLEELDAVLSRAISQLKSKTENNFFDSRSTQLLNSITELFKNEIAKKTGQPQKPSKTGFAKYASNRLKIETAVKKILSNVNKTVIPADQYVGNLGEKGDLFVRTNLRIQDGSVWNSDFIPAKSGVNKKPQKDFIESIISVSKYVYSTELFEKISELNQIDRIESINGVSDLFLFYRHFLLNNDVYQPSNGESSMLLLYKELAEEKEIYLIDEPEKSLGNDYISDVIVPLLKEKALMGKKIIVATHDANIAVRTLPYNSIYRLHDLKQYYTLVGNPFSNKLKCIHGVKADLDWKEISMKTLEGGKDAFGERGKIYGN